MIMYVNVYAYVRVRMYVCLYAKEIENKIKTHTCIYWILFYFIRRYKRARACYL